MAQFGALGLDLASQPAPDVVTKKAVAEVLGVHPSRVSQLIKQGMPTEPNGRVSIAKARAWAAAHLDPTRAKILRDTGQGRPSSAGGAIRVELDTVRVARARLELDRQRGALVDRQSVEAAVFARARAERDAHMAWAVRVAPVIAVRLGIDAAVLLAQLEAEMRLHLEQLAGLSLQELLPS